MTSIIESYRIDVQPEGRGMRIRAVSGFGTKIDAALPRSVALALADEVLAVDGHLTDKRSAAAATTLSDWQAQFGPIETD